MSDADIDALIRSIDTHIEQGLFNGIAVLYLSTITRPYVAAYMRSLLGGHRSYYTEFHGPHSRVENVREWIKEEVE